MRDLRNLPVSQRRWRNLNFGISLTNEWRDERITRNNPGGSRTTISRVEK